MGFGLSTIGNVATYTDPYGNYNDSSGFELVGASALVFILIAIAMFAFIFYVYYRIISKTGYSGWWVLSLFVPILPLVLLLLLAFKEWPIEERIRQLESNGHNSSGYGSYGTPTSYTAPPEHHGYSAPTQPQYTSERPIPQPGQRMPQEGQNRPATGYPTRPSAPPQGGSPYSLPERPTSPKDAF